MLCSPSRTNIPSVGLISIHERTILNQLENFTSFVLRMDFISVPDLSKPCLTSKSSFCKILINPDQFSKLMEFCNGDIDAMKSVTGVACHVSNETSYFPGTTDRVMSLIGPLVQICVAIQLLAEVFRICASATRPQTGSSDYALIGVRLIVPNSVVGMIMGKGGKDVRSLAIDNSVRIQISKRIPGVLERMVSVAGRSDHVCSAAFVLIETIQADHRTGEHAMVLHYAHAPDALQQMTKHLDELVSQLSLYPTLFAAIRNA